MVPADQMAAYISSQVDALRYFTVTAGQTRDHWGFAWAPSNTTGMPAGEFATQTGRLLDRLAAAIRDSAEAADPEIGTGACGPPGQDAFCLVDIEGAGHNAAWRSFRVWTQLLLTIQPATQTVSAGVPSAPSTVSLATSTGAPVTTGPAVAVTLGSSSQGGAFATSAEGPWTPTLALSVGPGAPATYYYRDAVAGTATVTASATGTTSGTQAVTVTAGPVARVSVAPRSGLVAVRGTETFDAAAADAYGNEAPAPLAWSLTPHSLGTIRTKGTTATLTAGRIVGTGTLSASAGTALVGRASVRVAPGRLHVRMPLVKRTAGGVRMIVSTVDDAGRPVSRTAIKVVAVGAGRRMSARATTGAAGKAHITLATRPGCSTVTVTRARSQGFVWSGQAPRARVCR
jgi:hypothetical protein